MLFVPPLETGTVERVMAPPPVPRTSNDVPESGEVNETVDVAIVLTIPELPTYATPCDRDER